MKVLVLGGNRFFGKRLVDLLLEQGEQVMLLNRGLHKDDWGDRVERIRLDRRELRAGHPALGALNWDVVYDQVCYDAREAAGAVETFSGRVGRYVFTSSKSVYRYGADLREKDFDPRSHRIEKLVDSDSDYGEAKRQAEALFFQKAPFPVVAARLPIVLGLDDYTGRLRFHVEHVRDGKPIYFPNPDAKTCFIEAGDAAAFLASVRHSGSEGPVNVCSQPPIPLRDLMAMIGRELGKSARFAARDEAEESPFGIDADWYMETPRLVEFGFQCQATGAWLPGLVRQMAQALR